ncbi:hypothetical protein GO730_05200 [Spirosoma sp. HMF3257]|uniref:Oligosaccharide repeat unit polymerase n=1 Tax=Spirosoma telluris TaxID=2183553 RepID=A0A327NJ09_9BACT|nr:hypothetical protein [Spirosoma telluris]RAI73914.1 hypothetical protein HMF3257_05170 [Spirosoma telluris]
MKKYLLIIICCLAAQLTPLVYRAIFNYNEYFIYPSLLSHTLLFIPIFIVFHLKNRFTKAFLTFWMLWLYLGELKILNYYAINPYYIAMDEGCIIYNIFLIAMSVGMLIHDANYTFPSISPEQQATGRLLLNDLTWFEYPLLLFPLVWFADFFRNVGYIPIFSGSDVTEKMYHINYGYVYNFGFFNCVSAVHLYDRFLRSSRTPEKVFWLSMAVLAILITSIDSKRLFLLISISSIFFYEKIMNGKFTLNMQSIGMITVAAILYVSLQNLRLGSSSASQFAREGLPMGVEFREYIRAVNEFKPGEIPGYDLTASTLANLINSAILNVAGINKADLISKDSALTFMTLFDPDNTMGIRTGLISELYFAYDFYGLIIMLVFGYMVSYVAYAMLNAQMKSSMILLIIIFSLLMLTAFGQSSVTAGSLTVLFYLHLLIRWARPSRYMNGIDSHSPESDPDESTHQTVPA